MYHIVGQFGGRKVYSCKHLAMKKNLQLDKFRFKQKIIIIWMALVWKITDDLPNSPHQTRCVHKITICTNKTIFGMLDHATMISLNHLFYAT